MPQKPEDGAYVYVSNKLKLLFFLNIQLNFFVKITDKRQDSLSYSTFSIQSMVF